MKELLKSDSIWKNYAQMKKGPVFDSLCIFAVQNVKTNSSSLTGASNSGGAQKSRFSANILRNDKPTVTVERQ